MVSAKTAESARLHALESYSILDTLPEQQFDDLTQIAAAVCGVPTAMVSFVSRDRQWAKATRGFALKQIPRELSFCAHSIESRRALVVEDAAIDPKFQDNALVASQPGIRFYAGAPIIEKHGHVLGNVCVLDEKPHQLSADQIAALEALARQAVGLLEHRSAAVEKAELVEEMRLARWEADQYRQHLELATDTKALASWTYAAEGDLLRGDQRMQTLFGLPEPRVPLNQWLATIRAEDRAKVAGEFAAALCGSSLQVQFELADLSQQGAVYARARCLIDSAGKQSLIGVCERLGTT